MSYKALSESEFAKLMFEQSQEEAKAKQPPPFVDGAHSTEKSCPQQCAEFREIIERMYRLHLQKNSDYSPYNVLATGDVGVVTRLWDKMARLMNLSGFDISTGKYSGPKDAKNESVEDTLLDMANYAVIALILKRGKWGK